MRFHPQTAAHGSRAGGGEGEVDDEARRGNAVSHEQALPL